MWQRDGEQERLREGGQRGTQGEPEYNEAISEQQLGAEELH